MLTLAEIGPGLYGAWRLAHFDPAGMRFFDRSIRGFWRSFYVAVLAAPLWIIILAVTTSHADIGGDWVRFSIAQIVGYVIRWIAYPLAAFYLTRLFDRQEDYVGFIVALNWGTLIELAVQTPAYVIANTGLLPSSLDGLLVYAAFVAILVYEWFITRTALRLPGLGAAGFVVVDTVISFVVDAIVSMEVHLF
jgi:hypothetical protein